MHNRLIYLIILILWTQLGGSAFAVSSSKLVHQGNQAYKDGHYDKALNAYNEAFVESPESPYIYYNKGAAYYRQGDYTKAIDAFTNAALKTKDLNVEAQCQFNMGDCAYREMERQMDSDLQKSLEACQKSIVYFQEALKLNPKMREAGENIEIARLTAKNLLDQIKKQEEERKKKEEAQKAAKEQLEQLIQRQENALNSNRELSASGPPSPKNKELQEQLVDLATDQKKLKNDTKQFSDQLAQKAKNQIPPEVNEHLSKAVDAQDKAVKQLDQLNTKSAQSSQEDALKALQEANAALSKNQQQKGQQDQQKNGRQDQQKNGRQDQQKKGQQSQPDKKQNQNKKGRAQKPDKSQDKQQKVKQQATAQLPDDADDIIKEEHENKKRRQFPTKSGYRAVEKDW